MCAALQGEADALYADAEEWTRRSVLYTAGNGFFSSDRTIDQYAKASAQCPGAGYPGTMQYPGTRL